MAEKNIGMKTLVTVCSVIICVFIGVFMLNGYMNGKFKSVETFETYISSFGFMAPAVFVFIQAVQVVIPVVPGFVGCAAGAVMFGTGMGFVYNYVGICAGSIIAFWLARRFGTSFVKRVVAEDKYDKYTKWISEKKCFTVVLWLTILLPLAPDDVFCYLSGLTKMSGKKFTGIILAAKPWCILAYSLFFGMAVRA